MYNFSLPKVDLVSTQPAAEMNSVFNELENAVTKSGQTLSNGDNNQLVKALAVYATGGDFGIDSGAADAYVVTPGGTRVAPPAYFDGMRVRFIPGNTNTGASTMNYASLGSKQIKRGDGTASLLVGDIQADTLCEVFYNAANDVWILNSIQGLAGYSLGANGYIILQNGLKFQWGTAIMPANPGSSSSTVSVVFPVAFTTQVFGVFPAYGNSPNPPWEELVTAAYDATITLSGCVITGGTAESGILFTDPVTITYFAIGV